MRGQTAAYSHNRAGRAGTCALNATNDCFVHCSRPVEPSTVQAEATATAARPTAAVAATARPTTVAEEVEENSFPYARGN